jgi:hypothetical protein
MFLQSFVGTSSRRRDALIRSQGHAVYGQDDAPSGMLRRRNILAAKAGGAVDSPVPGVLFAGKLTRITGLPVVPIHLPCELTPAWRLPHPDAGDG